MQHITERIRQEARRLLENQHVDVIIGYQLAWDGEAAIPCFAGHASEVDRLVFSERCTHNLAKYLVGREGYLTSRFQPQGSPVRVALVARPETLRTVAALIQECQFARGDLIVLGIVDGTPAGIEPDIEVGRIGEIVREQQELDARIQRVTDLSLSERQQWWNEHFARCIRCYACRQVCPFCYCEQCIADQNQPQWIDRSPSLQNNIAWQLIRAYHLLGRCTGCGECDRVCPVAIPLSLINAKMAVEVEEAFGYVAGTDSEAEPALAAFRPSDAEPFVR